MVQTLGFLIGKAILIAPGLVLGWLHAGALWAVAGAVALAAAGVALSPARQAPQIEGAPRFVRTKAFAAVAVIFTAANLACYALASWLSPR